jgi:alpha-2-macroglobulin
VATCGGQPQLPWRLSAAFLASLTLLLSLSAAPGADAQYKASGYQPLEGEPFFLLSDRSFGPTEIAQVRLEVANGSYGMSQVTEYGGVDVVLYRVPRPIEFLKQQKNLHRVRVAGLAREEGLANTWAHLWDRWYQATRLAWRKVFTPEARTAVTDKAPELKTSRPLPTRFEHAPQWQPLSGFDLVSRFRYPVHRAQPIRPPEGVKLQGSSSEFMPPTEGNVMIPLGRLRPGLYLVEGSVGGYRATSLVFVSDSVAITKTSSGEMLVWTAGRAGGAAVPGVQLAWSDGAGVLQSGTSDKSGLFHFVHAVPERSYVFGEDPLGGVFISEAFYYDSEIYDTKIYAVTDRPLYRPGDQVSVKFVGRRFLSARESAPVPQGPIALTVFDPGGVPVASQRLQLSPATGADTSFRLPENAGGGGYELRFTFDGNAYGAAFRVAEYQKPHFEITLVPDKADLKTGEEIRGHLQLSYPDGKPVKQADVQLSVRAQQLTMVDGELGYYGQFPVKLSSDALRSDDHGLVPFVLPAATQPSRYVLTISATDGAAYRVKTTRELLVERGQSAYRLRALLQFSDPGETVSFEIQPIGTPQAPAASWDWVRLEDQHRESGTLGATPGRLELTFKESGSYTVELRDARGNLVAGTQHWISGGGVKPPTGSISLVASREKCRPGETVDILISFPEPVDEALLTLERDRVEEAALLSGTTGWVHARRVAATQWRARLRVRADFAPNITFSVAYVKNGDYVFQNQGLQVEQTRVDVALHPDKAAYAPGETVSVEVATTMGGRAVPATVAVGVVDEMIYALQPEIAPDIYDFFYHPRRNNVRTAASLSFIGYDLAASRAKGAPEQHAVSQRRVKVLERPRREDVDTAYWQPALRTDARGQARFTFVMPDSLTRWRITGRAFTADGIVGQRTAQLRSARDLYVKWTSPTWMRQGDQPIASIAVFNESDREQIADLQVSGPGVAHTERLTLKPGATYVALPLAAMVGDGSIRVALSRNGKEADALETRFQRLPAAWRTPHSLVLELKDAATPLALPADARNVRMTFAPTAAAQFGRVIDDLLEYPYGCIEQTASRMIPLSLAIEALGDAPPQVGDRLRQQLAGQRLRLAYMAGPKAMFTWWGSETTGDPFLTAYAYYADWLAVRALGLELPREHWSRMNDVYAADGYKLPPVQRALMLHFMQQTGLPVKGLVEGLLSDLQKHSPDVVVGVPRNRLSLLTSPIMSEPDSALSNALALAVADGMVRREKLTPPPALEVAAEKAYVALDASTLPLAHALLLANGRRPASEAAGVLEAVTAEMATMERALTLAFVRGALAGSAAEVPSPSTPEGAWRGTPTLTGTVRWSWPNLPVPTELRLPSAPARPLSAVVQFDSASASASALPVGIERTLYRVKKSGAEGYELETLPPGAALSTNELYLDEIRVTPTGRPLRYAMLEVALPPGASVESTTWGIDLPDRDGKLRGLERARHQATRDGYVVPVDGLSEPTALRHLVRLAQRGSFVLPPARLYRMYQPEARGVEAGAARRWEVR